MSDGLIVSIRGGEMMGGTIMCATIPGAMAKRSPDVSGPCFDLEPLWVRVA